MGGLLFGCPDDAPCTRCTCGNIRDCNRQDLLSARNKTSVLSVGIRETVPDRRHTTAGDDQPVIYGTMLPKDVVPVGSIAVFTVVIPRLLCPSNHQQVLPVLLVNAQIAFVQAVQGEVWKLA